MSVSGSRNPNVEEEEKTFMGKKLIYSMHHQQIESYKSYRLKEEIQKL